MQLRNPALLETIFTLQGDFSLGGAPSPQDPAFGIEVAPFQGNADAACCISADFEMGWGCRSQGLPGADAMGLKERASGTFDSCFARGILRSDHLGDGWPPFPGELPGASARRRRASRYAAAAGLLTARGVVNGTRVIPARTSMRIPPGYQRRPDRTDRGLASGPRARDPFVQPHQLSVALCLGELITRESEECAER